LAGVSVEVSSAIVAALASTTILTTSTTPVAAIDAIKYFCPLALIIHEAA
jgi:hypothetical protein